MVSDVGAGGGGEMDEKGCCSGGGGGDGGRENSKLACTLILVFLYFSLSCDVPAEDEEALGVWLGRDLFVGR